MKAIRLTEPCEANELQVSLVDRPAVKPGYALIKVHAFGVNESEVTSRKGQSSSDFSYPRILGIEGVGVIAEVAEGSSFVVGQQVATMMNGLGREHDGSYAEYMLVKETYLIPFTSELDWGTIGALPEMLQTANGSLRKSLNLQKGETIFIHGGTSTVGLMAISLAHQIGARVIATSRKEDKLASLSQLGCDYPLLDDANLYQGIKEIAPEGVDKILELVGADVMASDLKVLKKGGILCFTGALNDHWTLENFSPFIVPAGVYLTSYAGDSTDLSSEDLTTILKAVQQGTIILPIAKVYRGLEEVGKAHTNLESHQFIGKHVVVLE